MTVLLIAISVGSLLTLIIASACHRFYKLGQFQTTKIADLQNQLAILSAGAVGSDERIINFEQTLSRLKEHQNTMGIGLSSQPSYDHAIRLAKKGVSINQLIDNCNLSDEEAHLIERIHGNKQSAAHQDIH